MSLGVIRILFNDLKNLLQLLSPRCISEGNQEEPSGSAVGISGDL